MAWGPGKRVGLASKGIEGLPRLSIVVPAFVPQFMLDSSSNPIIRKPKSYLHPQTLQNSRS